MQFSMFDDVIEPPVNMSEPDESGPVQTRWTIYPHVYGPPEAVVRVSMPWTSGHYYLRPSTITAVREADLCEDGVECSFLKVGDLQSEVLVGVSAERIWTLLPRLKPKPKAKA